MKTINVFPNRVFTENLQLTKEQNDSILDEVDYLVDREQVDDTHFGWITPNGRSMGEQTGKLKLSMIRPGQAVPHFVTKYSWYTAIVFLQTTNRGSHLYFDDMGPRHFATPKGFDEWSHYIKPAKNKVIYFPSHLITGFTSNESMINNVTLSLNFLVK